MFGWIVFRFDCTDRVVVRFIFSLIVFVLV